MVWHSGLTEKNKRDLERVQKSALKIILKDRYIKYKNALDEDGFTCSEKREPLLEVCKSLC